jgi:hypothetical protein
MGADVESTGMWSCLSKIAGRPKQKWWDELACSRAETQLTYFSTVHKEHMQAKRHEMADRIFGQCNEDRLVELLCSDHIDIYSFAPPSFSSFAIALW